jgi:hypothetical protein
MEPARRAARVWCALVGVSLAVFGVLSVVGIRPGGIHVAIPSLGIAAICLLSALARVSYRKRAVAMVVLGLLAVATAYGGLSPNFAGAVGGWSWNGARTVAAIGIPAALLFRARYRAYGGARVLLAVALALALPFLVYVGLQMRGEFGLGHVASIVALVAFLVSLSGFMGAETTGAGAFLAPVAVVSFTVELALRALVPLRVWDVAANRISIPMRSIGYIIEDGAFAVAFASASALAALGVFQILASRFAADARRIDIHSRPTEPVEEPSSASTRSDWMTGG